MICLSCNNDHNEKFCPDCGEKSGVKKITFGSTIEDALSGLINMDRGFLFNLKSLVLVPKKISFDYIMGKRKGILNPLSFLILSVSLYLLITSLFKTEVNPEKLESLIETDAYKIGNAGGKFIRSYFKYFWIISTFALTLSTKIIYQKYNYLEHIAINSFIIGMATLVAIISYLIFAFPIVFDPFTYLSILILTYRIFKDDKDNLGSLLIAFCVVILFFIMILTTIASIGYLSL
jgi:hypothetical protein